VSHSEQYRRLVQSVEKQLRIERADAYRHALKYAGYMPQSIELAVQRNRKYLETGEDER
jgi:hypothetical protein